MHKLGTELIRNLDLQIRGLFQSRRDLTPNLFPDLFRIFTLGASAKKFSDGKRIDGGTGIEASAVGAAEAQFIFQGFDKIGGEYFLKDSVIGRRSQLGKMLCKRCAVLHNGVGSLRNMLCEFGADNTACEHCTVTEFFRKHLAFPSAFAAVQFHEHRELGIGVTGFHQNRSIVDLSSVMFF